MSFVLSDNFNDNTIDVRDIIERVEDLRVGQGPRGRSGPAAGARVRRPDDVA